MEHFGSGTPTSSGILLYSGSEGFDFPVMVQSWIFYMLEILKVDK